MTLARTISLAVLAFLLAPPLSLACSVSYVGQPTEVRHNFLVRITHDGKPLPGVEIEVERDKRTGDNPIVFRGTTGTDGTIRVKLSAGKYFIDGTYLGVSIGAGVGDRIRVSTWSSRKAENQLEYSWGDEATAARRVAGQLNVSGPGHTGDRARDNIFRADYPIDHGKLRLDGPSNPDPRETTTDDQGHFSFGALPPGTYVVHVSAGKLPDGFEYTARDLVMRVDPAANASAFTLILGGAICGGSVVAPVRD
jgi:hypothetical protein